MSFEEQINEIVIKSQIKAQIKEQEDLLNAWRVTDEHPGKPKLFLNDIQDVLKTNDAKTIITTLVQRHLYEKQLGQTRFRSFQIPIDPIDFDRFQKVCSKIKTILAARLVKLDQEIQGHNYALSVLIDLYPPQTVLI